jgi:uncharacterized protein with PQ loop repeat
MRPDLIGWASSAILVLTLTVQTWKTYRSCSTKGVSKWLYVGEIAAATGFVAYSALLRNRVFVVANVLGALTAIVGLVIFARNRRWERRHSTLAPK